VKEKDKTEENKGPSKATEKLSESAPPSSAGAATRTKGGSTNPTKKQEIIAEVNGEDKV